MMHCAMCNLVFASGEMRPSQFTAASMDAPTENQFDCPVQARKARDAVKGLATAKKWSSKIMGIMIAGLGMMVFVSRDGLGAGGNLSCTVLYRALMACVQHGRPLGKRFHLLLDNTYSDNKCNAVIWFLAWLVAEDIFLEASFFCMMVGHTYSRIDQSFRTLIRNLLVRAIWSIPQLLEVITTSLLKYNILFTEELHCVWDWTAYLEPHVHSAFGFSSPPAKLHGTIHGVPVLLGAARGGHGTSRSAPGRARIVAARPPGRLDDDSRPADRDTGTGGRPFTGSCAQQLRPSCCSVAPSSMTVSVSSRDKAERGPTLSGQ